MIVFRIKHKRCVRNFGYPLSLPHVRMKNQLERLTEIENFSQIKSLKSHQNILNQIRNCESNATIKTFAKQEQKKNENNN